MYLAHFIYILSCGDSRITKVEGKQEEIDGVKFELSNHTDTINSIQTAQYEPKITILEAQLQKDNLCFHGLRPQRENNIECVKLFSLKH